MSLVPPHPETIDPSAIRLRRRHYFALPVRDKHGYFRARRSSGLRVSMGQTHHAILGKTAGAQTRADDAVRPYGLVIKSSARRKAPSALGGKTSVIAGEHRNRESAATNRHVRICPRTSRLRIQVENGPDQRRVLRADCGVPSHVLPSRTPRTNRGADHVVLRSTVSMFVPRLLFHLWCMIIHSAGQATLTGILRRHLADLPLFRALPAFSFFCILQGAIALRQAS